MRLSSGYHCSYDINALLVGLRGGVGANSAKYYNVNHRHRPHDVSAAPSHRLPQGTLGCTARTFARGRGHTSVGLGERPGGPNLREGGAIGLESAVTCAKNIHQPSSPPHVSPGLPLPVHTAHMLHQPPPTHTHRHQGLWRVKYLG